MGGSHPPSGSDPHLEWRNSPTNSHTQSTATSSLIETVSRWGGSRGVAVNFALSNKIMHQALVTLNCIYAFTGDLHVWESVTAIV